MTTPRRQQRHVRAQRPRGHLQARFVVGMARKARHQRERGELEVRRRDVPDARRQQPDENGEGAAVHRLLHRAVLLLQLRRHRGSLHRR
jgi:hypothetical protein